MSHPDGATSALTEPLARVAERLSPGARVCMVRRLTGGVSAEVYALELEESEGRRRTVVVRRHGAAQVKPRQENVAAMEYGLLQVVHEAGLPVPEPFLLDLSGRILSGPFLVTSFVEGTTDVPARMLDDCLEIMAATLMGIHGLPIDKLPEMPARMDPLPEVFDYLPDSTEWRPLRDWLAGAGDTAYRGPPCLLHGDFWPGNLLWQEGRLMAVLDWEDAALGDPVSDVAVTRLELLWRYGPEARERFTRACERERTVDARRLALWDVYVAAAAARFMSSWGLERAREARMRRLASESVQAAGQRLMAG